MYKGYLSRGEEEPIEGYAFDLPEINQPFVWYWKESLPGHEQTGRVTSTVVVIYKRESNYMEFQTNNSTYHLLYTEVGKDEQ